MSVSAATCGSFIADPIGDVRELVDLIHRQDGDHSHSIGCVYLLNKHGEMEWHCAEACPIGSVQ